MTRAFVPGGPEPNKNGLGNLTPLTVIERSMIDSISDCRLPIATALRRGFNFRFDGFTAMPPNENQHLAIGNRN
jgi:hypothetical protein